MKFLFTTNLVSYMIFNSSVTNAYKLIGISPLGEVRDFAGLKASLQACKPNQQQTIYSIIIFIFESTPKSIFYHKGH
jgi:hypothetical protein